MKEKDISKMINMVNGINFDDNSIDKLKNEAQKKGVMDKAKELEEEYAPKFQQFIRENGDLTHLSNEEKARVILEYKERLSPKEQKQFDNILNMLKSYVKKIK
ncbi:hypothetical protein [Anaerofustis sp.]|uniref:hypothetical protein n=1 Tax=Anaerofustis sp. TaxID=1872517 RepID=UPI0025C0597C|nr:hypothetical protein [Anaerofustis sp.]